MSKTNNQITVDKCLAASLLKEFVIGGNKYTTINNSVNSCIREADRIGVRERRVFCREKERQAVSKIRRVVAMKLAIQDGKRCNTEAMRERG